MQTSFWGFIARHEIHVYRKVRPSKLTRAASCFNTGTMGFGTELHYLLFANAMSVVVSIPYDPGATRTARE